MWSLELSAAPRIVDLAESFLSSTELAHARSFRFPWLVRRYVLAHAALRILLSGYTGEHHAALRFVTGPYGKPGLAGPATLHFNLSGSGEFALLGLSPDCPVGVDVEQVRPLTHLNSLAHSVLTPAEAAAVLPLPAEEGTRRLFQLWTRKEACLKAAGFGLSVEAGTLECLGGRLTWREGAPAVFPLDDLTLYDLEPAPDYVGACVAGSAQQRLTRPRLRWMSISASRLLSEW